MSDEILQGPALHEKIAEVMQRREDYWIEFERLVLDEWTNHYGGTSLTPREEFYAEIARGKPFRYHAPKVKLEGEVEPGVIELAYEVQGWEDSKEANEVAKALLACVKEEE